MGRMMRCLVIFLVVCAATCLGLLEAEENLPAVKVLLQPDEKLTRHNRDVKRDDKKSLKNKNGKKSADSRKAKRKEKNSKPKANPNGRLRNKNLKKKKEDKTKKKTKA